MIGSIKGKIILQTEKHVIIETSSGIGYKVNIHLDETSLSESSARQDLVETFFWIHTHVREDMFDLYGFLDLKELEFFEMLIGVSGIGPKGALGILGIASIDTLKKAIATGDISYLTKISGIGKKTAEKIVIELRDKLAKESEKEGGTSLQGELDVLEALKSLGYSQNEARIALKKVTPELNTNAKIKEALKILGGK